MPDPYCYPTAIFKEQPAIVVLVGTVGVYIKRV